LVYLPSFSLSSLFSPFFKNIYSHSISIRSAQKLLLFHMFLMLLSLLFSVIPFILTYS
jgi:hypothetical protein